MLVSSILLWVPILHLFAHGHKMFVVCASALCRSKIALPSLEKGTEGRKGHVLSPRKVSQTGPIFPSLPFQTMEDGRWNKRGHFDKVHV